MCQHLFRYPLLISCHWQTHIQLHTLVHSQSFHFDLDLFVLKHQPFFPFSAFVLFSRPLIHRIFPRCIFIQHLDSTIFHLQVKLSVILFKRFSLSSRSDVKLLLVCSRSLEIYFSSIEYSARDTRHHVRPQRRAAYPSFKRSQS